MAILSVIGMSLNSRLPTKSLQMAPILLIADWGLQEILLNEGFSGMANLNCTL